MDLIPTTLETVGKPLPLAQAFARLGGKPPIVMMHDQRSGDLLVTDDGDLVKIGEESRARYASSPEHHQRTVADLESRVRTNAAVAAAMLKALRTGELVSYAPRSPRFCLIAPESWYQMRPEDFELLMAPPVKVVFSEAEFTAWQERRKAPAPITPATPVQQRRHGRKPGPKPEPWASRLADLFKTHHDHMDGMSQRERHRYVQTWADKLGGAPASATTTEKHWQRYKDRRAQGLR